jgi:adenine modification enzyme
MKKNGYIYSTQSSLWGEPEPIGFGNDEFCVRAIDRKLANKTIKGNHYSGTIVQGSFVHLGVFMNDEFVGALQFGPAMNPASCSSVVAGTQQDQYLELNRMWLSDVAPRNSESMAVSYSVKFIKRTLPRVKWIQSFADERCGGFGIEKKTNGNVEGVGHVSTGPPWRQNGNAGDGTNTANTIGRGVVRGV